MTEYVTRCGSGWLSGAIMGTVALMIPAAAGAHQLPEDSPRQLVAAVHVHSVAGSGSQTVLQLSREARATGIDVLLLTENFGYKFRYAPWPLRFFLEPQVSTPTVEDYDIERFLADVLESQEMVPEVLLLAGAEVIPYYYWTGSLWNGDLTLNNMQRNVLIALPPPGTRAGPGAGEALRGIPVVGNPYNRRFGARSLALLLPGLILVGSTLRKFRRRAARMRSSHTGRYRLDDSSARYVRGRPPFLDGHNWLLFTLLSMGSAMLYLNYPFSVPDLEPYDPAAGRAVDQRLFAYADEHGMLTFWSMPQAVDYHDRRVGPFSVRLSTHPYPQLLSETSGYTGFGGVYADTVTLWEAGAQWDEALLAFQRGERLRPPWMVGESAFHYAGQAGKELGDVLTVLLADEHTNDAAFAALAGGHGYAIRRNGASADLRLEEFTLNRTEASPDRLPRAAHAGDTLETGGDELNLVIRVDDVASTGTPVLIEVIRNGELYRRIEDTTPVQRDWLEALAPGEEAAYFRVVVRAAAPAYLVSNPVFLTRHP